MKKYIKFLLALGAMIGAGAHMIELVTPCIFFLLVLQSDLEDEVKDLKGSLHLTKTEEKLAWKEFFKLRALMESEGAIQEDKNGISSILDEYDPKQIHSATERLISSKLVDNKEQALLNLEMDLEERRLLATGGKG